MLLGLFLAGSAIANVATSPEVVVVGPRSSFPVPVPDTTLATMRGGVRLPNGLDLSLGIDIQTWIDGRLALHTVYASDGSQPGVRVYTDGTNPVRTAPATQTLSSDAVPGIPLLVVDRSPTGTTIVPTTTTGARTVNLVRGDPAIWLNGDNQVQIPVVANGPSVDAPPGEVSFAVDDDGAVITLRTPTLEVRQLVGQATGVVIANSADNVAIDTVSAINVDLRGLSPALLASTFAAQRGALEALVGR